MYKVKLDKVEMLKEGRTLVYLSEIIGLTTVHIGNILKGYKCTTLTAKAFVSIKEKISINDDKMEEFLNYYFEKIQ